MDTGAEEYKDGIGQGGIDQGYECEWWDNDDLGEDYDGNLEDYEGEDAWWYNGDIGEDYDGTLGDYEGEDAWWDGECEGDWEGYEGDWYDGCEVEGAI